MKHEIVIASTTGAVTTSSAVVDANLRPLNGVSADVNASEEDQVQVYTSPVLGAAETVGIFIVSAAGANVPAQTANGAVALLDATHQSVLLPGGMIYRFVKAGTVAPTTVEVYLKARSH